MRDEWRTIDSAPRGQQKSYGGGPRLMLSTNKRVFFGWFSWHKSGERGSWINDSGRTEAPSHWREPPAPPIDTDA